MTAGPASLCLWLVRLKTVNVATRDYSVIISDQITDCKQSTNKAHQILANQKLNQNLAVLRKKVSRGLTSRTLKLPPPLRCRWHPENSWRWTSELNDLLIGLSFLNLWILYLSNFTVVFAWNSFNLTTGVFADAFCQSFTCRREWIRVTGKDRYVHVFFAPPLFKRVPLSAWVRARGPRTVWLITVAADQVGQGT